MSEYYDYATPLTAGGLARAADVNTRFTELEPAFEKLPSPTKIQQGRITYCLDTGAANALVASLDFPPSAYTAGIELTVKVAATNTGVSTLNLNGLGVKTIKRANGSALAAGDLTAGYIVKLVYDGTDFRLLGASETAASSSATAAAASAAAAATSETNAATSATNAANSATAAANSATDAANSATDAANSAAAAGDKVAKSGDTMTGALTLSGAPTADLHASTKKYVDDAVFAAGSYTADGATITLSAGVFSLTTIANNTVLGNVSGAIAKPGALTATQLTALINSFSSTLSGAAPASGGGTTNYLRADGAWAAPPGTQTDITGNAGTATALQNARTIAISGTIATGTATSFDGTANISIPITSLNVGNATAGTLAVARGGTGVTSSTGTGSVVLSSAPTLSNPVVGTQASSDNSTKAASTAYVTSAISALSYAPKFLSIVTASSNVTLSDASHNNALINCTGSTSRTITMGTPSTGFSCVVKVTGSASRSLSCSGGVYKGSATSTATSGTIAAGGSVTLIHIGSGVWIADGQGLT